MDKELRAACEQYLSYEDHPTFTNELENLLENGDESELHDRFYTQLAFGTGGIRGKIGAGFNRMNPYMVKRATQGFANYIKQQNFSRPSAFRNFLNLL